MIKNLKAYQKSNTEKLDCITTGVSIERRHKVFIENERINLSQLVRDAIESIMPKEKPSGEFTEDDIPF